MASTAFPGDAFCRSAGYAGPFVYEEAAQECQLPAEEWFDLVMEVILVGLVLVLLGSAVVHVACRCSHLRAHTAHTAHAAPAAREAHRDHEEPLLGDELGQENARRINRGMKKGFEAGATGFAERAQEDKTLLRTEPEQVRFFLERFPTAHRIWNRHPGFCRRVSRVLYLLFKDHLKYTVGVGLPLFYNFHALPLFAFAFAWLISPHYHGAIAEDGSLTDPEAFAKDTCHALLYLYVFMVLHAWLHAKLGDVFAESFDTYTSSMSDYALLLTGLPPSATNERELLRELQADLPDAIGVSICYNLDCESVASTIDAMTQFVLDLEYEVNEVEEEEAQEQVDTDAAVAEATAEDLRGLLGGAADGRAQKKLLRGKLKRLLDKGALVGGSRAFVVFKTKACRNKALLRCSGIFCKPERVPKTEELERALSHHRPQRREEDWHQLLAPVELPPAPGGDPSVVRDLLLAGTRLRPHDEDTYTCERLVRVDRITCEPPSVNWHSIGTRRNDQKKKQVEMWGVLFLVFLVIVALVYFPWDHYIRHPYTVAGKNMKQTTGIFIGWIFALSNNILGAVLGQQLWGVGLMTSNRMNVQLFWYSAFISVANNVYTFWDPFWSDYPVQQDGWPNRTSEHAWEMQRSTGLYEMFVPGWLFLGFLTGQLVGAFLPFAVNWLILNCILVWNVFPMWLSKILSLLVPWCPSPDEKKLISKRAAELAFDPGELSLPWDYYNITYTPALCILLFFFTSPYMWHICPWVFVYILMMYAWHRFVMLTTKKKAMHTSMDLDRSALILWCVPCSMVASACALWAFRAGWIQSWLIPASFGASILIYCFGLLLLFSQKLSSRSVWSIDGDTHSVSIDCLDEPFNEVSMRTEYNWFNTNPVHVLKSRYLAEQVPNVSPWPFDFGMARVQRDAANNGDAARSR